ncbi:MAG: YggT family protein [Acidobacteria bacterium]|nr:YggT family protein [Acidobacteriota bacterium]
MNPGSAAMITLLLGIHWILNALEFFVVAWVILSWVAFFMQRSSFRWKHRRVFDTVVILNQFFETTTRPILGPFRRVLPPWKTGGIDFSPLLLLFVIYLLKTFLSLAFPLR